MNILWTHSETAGLSCKEETVHRTVPSPTPLSATPYADRVVGVLTSCSSFCSFSNFLALASGSSWALVANRTAHKRDQPTAVTLSFSSLPQCITWSSSNKWVGPVAFGGHPCTPCIWHRGHPSPHGSRWAVWDSPGGCLFPEAHSLSLPARGCSYTQMPRKALRLKVCRERLKRLATPIWQLIIESLKENLHMTHVLGSCKTKWIPVPLDSWQRII